MNPRQLYTLAVCFCFVYALAYFASEFFKAPMFWYYPLEHHWFFGDTPPKGLAMGWYGKVLFCLLCALPVTGLLAVIFKLSGKAFNREFQGLLDLATMVMVVITLFHLANSLAHRVI